MNLLRVLDDEGQALLKLARGAELTRPVPECPGWMVEDLVRHLTGVYRDGGAHRRRATARGGVDELVTGFAQRYRGWLRSAVPYTVSFSGTDVGRHWWPRLGPGEPEFGGGQAAATTEVAAGNGELLLLLWNRRNWEGLTVIGDETPLRIWLSDAHL